ncbi:carbohydrate-binding protein, partial [bacterium]|nr:carbohydrate-binding protein [bacterium]
WNFSWNPASPGMYEITARAIDDSGISVSSDPYTIYLAPAPGPFFGAPTTIPADIQAENYDGGGEGVGFHDTDATNELGFYRWDDVDIDKIAGASDEYCVASMQDGEWLGYTVTIPSTDVYDISIRTSSAVKTAQLHLELDGADVSGGISVPYSGSQGWRTVQIVGIPSNAGSSHLRLYVDSGGCKVDYFNMDYTINSISPPWQQKDIGATAKAGDAGVRGPTFIVTGSGSDVWGNTDEFHFVYQQINGDMEIQTRVASLTETDPWAKAGVMIRNTLDANSSHAMMIMSAANGLAFQRRTSTGGSSSHTAGTNTTAPYWVKLIRSGSRITAYESENGTNWTAVGVVTLSMSDPVYAGLMVTAHNDGSSCEARFENVTIHHEETGVLETATLSPTSLILHPAYPNPFNPSTIISFELPDDSQVNISIFNLLGKRIRTLKKDRMKAGTHSILWDARDDNDNRIATGLYVCKLQVNDEMWTEKLMFLK